MVSVPHTCAIHWLVAHSVFGRSYAFPGVRRPGLLLGGRLLDPIADSERSNHFREVCVMQTAIVEFWVSVPSKHFLDYSFSFRLYALTLSFQVSLEYKSQRFWASRDSTGMMQCQWWLPTSIRGQAKKDVPVHVKEILRRNQIGLTKEHDSMFSKVKDSGLETFRTTLTPSFDCHYCCYLATSLIARNNHSSL